VNKSLYENAEEEVLSDYITILYFVRTFNILIRYLKLLHFLRWWDLFWFGFSWLFI